ncbi:hypothetical protein FSARC_6227 [Fusarium sarcochroum]|uniref:HMG box domain-containing protein n=1 Tax=Fusarium sarcochroum TaxID=1208366 RepID=A0A8H4TXU4_9HYPO|nr:hypothetical protein FSARC_6227 [Fusarium sarcochroum]
MAESFQDGLLSGPMGVRMPPEAEVLFTFVYSQAQSDIHAFLPDTMKISLVLHIADNFSRRVEQPVKVFHDEQRSKYRLCPIPMDIAPDTSTYGRFCFTRDKSTPVKVSAEDPTVGEGGRRIPRPRNCWILYRQAKSQEITNRNEGITAPELSAIIARMWDNEPPVVQVYWQKLAEREEANHRRRYPGYRYGDRNDDSFGNSFGVSEVIDQELV